MNPTERLRSALDNSDPTRALRSVVMELAKEGIPKREIGALLENLVLELRVRNDHRDSDEDPILDVLDALVGWCYPNASIVPEK